ncbi:MAG: large subunit ribosomal protein L3 [Parcubacteria group bacterium Gr01-1014_48]|nr:MAG: large subunit ribosomal protein L3 [Parcubacteria group bacterium Greene0416_14]TSC73420.1 MAG: large subunit ribosomal protein L3 [Parcubacteria group bacterium Gr01-1014_48]TSD00833.1 MAG: large subunit ribosomal protein L3 [Parcubacteria group bacterium Greene1014_15]TSD07049.1 MAG: large subunit ribosomal protein L3 [Parcubacteria group bacterium Greene0714_4]
MYPVTTMKFILGKKEHMTQIFDDTGVVHPGTLVTAGPVTVTQIKTTDKKDGYNAVQVGFDKKELKKMNKAMAGHLKDLSGFKVVREYRTDEASAATRGTELSVAQFVVGDTVRVTATSKGKGFQGVVKRHGFHGGPRSHGQKHSEREPGSIGGGGRAGGRVIKGMRMAGRMGGDRVTVKNLTVLAIDAANNQMIISGAVPGRRGSLIEIRSI